MSRPGLILTIAGAATTFGGGLINAFPVVLASRGLEGLGAALFIPASTTLLLDVFPMAERGGAQGKMIMISLFITAFAPTLIGLIIQAVSWPYSYLLTVLSGSIAIWMVSRVKYEQKMPEHKPFDVSGSVLLFFAVTLLTVGIMQAGVTGLTSSSVLLLVGAGLAVGAQHGAAHTQWEAQERCCTRTVVAVLA